MTKRKRIMSIVLILSLVATLVFGTLVACSVLNENSADYVAEDGDGNKMETGKVHMMPSKMSFSAAALAAAGGQGVTISIQATVLPVEAQNKLVDWSVEWGSASTFGENPVTDFVTVTPQADGSNIANVTCYKAFSGDTIVVSVITRDGGFTATCSITFVGNPSTLEIVATGAEVKTDSGWNVPIVEVFSGKEYNFDLKFDNIFHSVNSNFVPNFTCEIVGVGQIELLYEKKNSSGVLTDSLTSTFGMSDTLEIIKNNSNGVDSGEKKLVSIQSKYFSANIENGLLKIVSKQAISAFRLYNSGRSYEEVYTFNGYVDENKKPYYQILITETQTGLSQTVNIRMEASVSEVKLNNSELTF